jgi:hypothetical protein
VLKPLGVESFAVVSTDVAPDSVEDRRQSQADGHPYRAPTDGRRSSPRRRVLLAGLIVEGVGETCLKCRIENVSPGGARLKLHRAGFVPPEFWLIAVTSGLAYKARIVWRRDETMGVALGDPTDLNDAVTLAQRRLRAFWRHAH